MPEARFLVFLDAFRAEICAMGLLFLGQIALIVAMVREYRRIRPLSLKKRHRTGLRVLLILFFAVDVFSVLVAGFQVPRLLSSFGL